MLPLPPTHTHTMIQTDREKETGRQTERQGERAKERETDAETDKAGVSERQRDRQWIRK